MPPVWAFEPQYMIANPLVIGGWVTSFFFVFKFLSCSDSEVAVSFGTALFCIALPFTQ